MNFHHALSAPTAGARFIPGRVRRHMQLLATAISGPVDIATHLQTLQLGNCLILAEAELLIHGTACDYPLDNPEVEAMASATGFDAVLLRATPDLIQGGSNLSFDIICHDYPHWLLGYRAWDGGHHGEWWFVPNDKSGPCVRAGKFGLCVTERAPFVDEADDALGLHRAARFLASAVREY